MKFSMKVSTNTALALIARIEDVAWSAGQQWDYIEFRLPDGTEFQYSYYAYWDKGRPVRPTEFTKMIGVAKSSTIAVVRDGGEWKVTFAGFRGSLSGHWGIVEMLKAESTEISEYETSVPGMQPWEDLYSWFCRLVGDPAALHPFDAMYDIGEVDDFNRCFHAAIKELVRKRKLNGQHLKLYRDIIVADIKRKYGWTNAA